jgi:hypothetical protein
VAISGFASDEPAVRAQYPDSVGGQQQERISTLENVVQATRGVARGRAAAAQMHATERRVAREVAVSKVGAVRLDMRDSSSIALLLASIGVLAVGGVLRWRKGQHGT